MANHFHALVWLDHRLAKVFHFNDTANETTLVHSSHSHEHLHHKANAGGSGNAPVDKDFLERVAQSVAQAGAVLILGPGSAKTELRTYIKAAHPLLAEKISAVEPVDHPTDGELLAYGRHFFIADDRMRFTNAPQPLH